MKGQAANPQGLAPEDWKAVAAAAPAREIES
jgi:hypothetical protein